MATTSNYGWTTPDDTAYVKDGASAIRTLGSAIDSTLKTQIDAQIPDSLLTTTGDVIYASSANTPARLGIGSTNQVLTVSGGLPVWANTSAFEPVLTPEFSTYYITNSNSGTLQTPSVTTNRTYYIPVFLSTFTADRIGFRNGNYTSAGLTRLGLYSVNSTTGKPANLIFDAGTVNVTAASTDYTITINQNITAGWYYFAINRQSGSYTWNAYDGINPSLANIGTSPTSGTSQNGMFSEDSITGAFANAGTVTPRNTPVPAVGLRVA
jgi:hypothetical protein